MISFLWNIFLALIWCFATGVFNPINLAVGYVLGFLVLLFTQQIIGSWSIYSPEYWLWARYTDRDW